MTEGRSSIIPNREQILFQLLQSLAGPISFESARLLCTQLWLLQNEVESATLLTVHNPSVIRASVCRRSEHGKQEFRESLIEEPCASVLSRQLSLDIAPHILAGNHRDVLIWPDLLATLVIESPSPSGGMAGSGSFRDIITPICRQLLAAGSELPVLFPNPDRMAAMAEFAAGAGHEINNPLGSIIGQTQLLLRKEDNIERRQALELIGAQAWRIRDMIGDSMLFARPPAMQPTLVDLVECCDEVVRGTAAVHGSDQIDIQFQCMERKLSAECDRDQFRVLLNHLLKNSIESVRSGNEPGRIVVRLGTSRGDHAVALTVSDTGPGITNDEVRRHLFDPFFSGRQAGRGLGFGLSLCARIVTEHHGMLLHWETAEKITEFHAVLPLRQNSAARIS